MARVRFYAKVNKWTPAKMKSMGSMYDQGCIMVCWIREIVILYCEPVLQFKLPPLAAESIAVVENREGLIKRCVAMPSSPRYRVHDERGTGLYPGVTIQPFSNTQKLWVELAEFQCFRWIISLNETFWILSLYGENNKTLVHGLEQKNILVEAL